MGSNLDLFIWQAPTGAILRFQLSYDQQKDEKSFIWDRESGYTHARVDDGVTPGKHPASPILQDNIAPIPADIIRHLTDQLGELPKRTYNEVCQRIRAFSMTMQ